MALKNKSNYDQMLVLRQLITGKDKFSEKENVSQIWLANSSKCTYSFKVHEVCILLSSKVTYVCTQTCFKKMSFDLKVSYRRLTTGQPFFVCIYFFLLRNISCIFKRPLQVHASSGVPKLRRSARQGLQGSFRCLVAPSPKTWGRFNQELRTSPTT